jgi:serine-type D-Ala-D-Ala carboxypeptidase
MPAIKSGSNKPPTNSFRKVFLKTNENVQERKLWRYFNRSLVLLFILSGWIISCSNDLDDNESIFSKADELIETAINERLIPGAVILVGSADSILYHRAFGDAVIYNREGTPLPEPVEMTKSTLFDIASLTKIFATTYGVKLLHSRGLLNLDEPVSNYLSEFNTEDKRSITVRHLLSHTSGLQPWYPTYYKAIDKYERLLLISEIPTIGTAGEQRRYSDLGFMLLADLIEHIADEPIEQFLDRNIYHPLELTSTIIRPDTSYLKSIAATSHGNPFEKRMVYDNKFGFTIDIDPESWNGWRDYVLSGEVNDGNAFYTHNGFAGHAGLFSTAEDLYRLSALVLNDGKHDQTKIFSKESIKQFLETDSFGHGLGYMMDNQSLNAKELPEGSFGHTGFTGTSFVVIPDENLIIILLTNRQHFGVDHETNYPDLRELRSDLTELFLNLLN